MLSLGSPDLSYPNDHARVIDDQNSLSNQPPIDVTSALKFRPSIQFPVSNGARNNGPRSDTTVHSNEWCTQINATALISYITGRTPRRCSTARQSSPSRAAITFQLLRLTFSLLTQQLRCDARPARLQQTPTHVPYVPYICSMQHAHNICATTCHINATLINAA